LTHSILPYISPPSRDPLNASQQMEKHYHECGSVTVFDTVSHNENVHFDVSEVVLGRKSVTKMPSMSYGVFVLYGFGVERDIICDQKFCSVDNSCQYCGEY
jgi:hypothetical protein